MPAGLAIFEKLVQTEKKKRIKNLERLRDLSLQNRSEVKVFCAHDPVEFDHLV
jgi:hypothetical protein